MTEKNIFSCGGVVIYRGKALVLYQKNNRISGWVLPKGKREGKESHKDTAIREVREEAGVIAKVIKPLGKTHYSFNHGSSTVNKTVYWFLMAGNSYNCKPQLEEYFTDGGFYKEHEAYHLLRYQDEKEILSRAFEEYYRGLNSTRKGNDNFV